MAAILSLYLLGALATFAVSLRFASDDLRRAAALGVAALCGVLWPILVVGLALVLVLSMAMVVLSTWLA
jgi:hypothetical protein